MVYHLDEFVYLDRFFVLFITRQTLSAVIYVSIYITKVDCLEPHQSHRTQNHRSIVVYFEK